MRVVLTDITEFMLARQRLGTLQTVTRAPTIAVASGEGTPTGPYPDEAGRRGFQACDDSASPFGPVGESGLGLAICHAIATARGGVLTFASEA